MNDISPLGRDIRLVLFVGLVQVMAAATTNAESPIRSDERVVFFPTAATLTADGLSWKIPIHGWIFEPEEGDLARCVDRGHPAAFVRGDHAGHAFGCGSRRCSRKASD